MILVVVGSSSIPFDRLLQAVDLIEPGEPIVVQRGPSHVMPLRAMIVDFMTFDEMVEHIERARVVVTHAGVGTILVSLMKGKRPIVVPRRHKHGEAVDDHQLELAQRLHGEGIVTLVEDPAALPGAVRVHSAGEGTVMLSDGALAHELRSLLIELVGPKQMPAPVGVG